MKVITIAIHQFNIVWVIRSRIIKKVALKFGTKGFGELCVMMVIHCLLFKISFQNIYSIFNCKDFGENEAKVFCRSLGYDGAAVRFLS